MFAVRAGLLQRQLEGVSVCLVAARRVASERHGGTTLKLRLTAAAVKQFAIDASRNRHPCVTSRVGKIEKATGAVTKMVDSMDYTGLHTLI